MLLMGDQGQQIYTSPALKAILASAVHSYNDLILKHDNFKLDLDSSEGQASFKTYIGHIEDLISHFIIPTQPRSFRHQYTNAYKVLYEDSELGYIPEIFDAAQEGFTCIWVNAQCYIFDASTLEKGQRLVEVYFRLIQQARKVLLLSYEANHQKRMQPAINDLKSRLAEFDLAWIHYERAYIQELIAIEEQAKIGIIEAVEIQRALSDYEASQRIKGKIFFHSDSEFHESRSKLCKKIAELNSVANINGKGRDDLSQDILTAAENVLTKISHSQSRSLRNVAEKIRESFNKVRGVLRDFGENISLVDPQLRNNAELVEALSEYEVYWEKGKRYFVEKRKESQILTLSTILEAAKEKHPSFKDLVEFSDPSVFWMIASVVVLNSLEGEDEGLAESFLQEISPTEKLQLQFTELKEHYKNWKTNQASFKSNELYNEIQKQLVEELQDQHETGELAKKIKQFAVNLERTNPSEWNDMLSVILTDDE